MRPLRACLFIFFFAFPALAQHPTTGFSPFGSFDNGRFDAVNRQNLNVNFAIPIMSSPGRGMALTHSVVYDSLIWERVDNTWSPVTASTGGATWGWKYDSVTGESSYNSEDLGICDTGSGIPEFATHYHSFSYTSPDGTRHNFNLDFYSVRTSCGFPQDPGGVMRWMEVDTIWTHPT